MRTSWGRSEQPRRDVPRTSDCDVPWTSDRDGQIGSLGDVLRTLEGNVLRTSWGPIFGCWVHCPSNRYIKKLQSSINVSKYFHFCCFLLPLLQINYQLKYWQSEYFYKQKQPSIGVLIKRYSENMQQVYCRTPMKCDFNKVTEQLY